MEPNRKSNIAIAMGTVAIILAMLFGAVLLWGHTSAPNAPASNGCQYYPSNSTESCHLLYNNTTTRVYQNGTLWQNSTLWSNETSYVNISLYANSTVYVHNTTVVEEWHNVSYWNNTTVIQSLPMAHIIGIDLRFNYSAIFANGTSPFGPWLNETVNVSVLPNGAFWVPVWFNNANASKVHLSLSSSEGWEINAQTPPSSAEIPVLTGSSSVVVGGGQAKSVIFSFGAPTALGEYVIEMDWCVG